MYRLPELLLTLVLAGRCCVHGLTIRSTPSKNVSVRAIAPVPEKNDVRHRLSEIAWFLRNHQNIPDEITSAIFSYLPLPLVPMHEVVTGQRFLLRHPTTGKVQLCFVDVPEHTGLPIKVWWLKDNSELTDDAQFAFFTAREWNRNLSPYRLRGQLLDLSGASGYSNLMISCEKHLFNLRERILQHSSNKMIKFVKHGGTRALVVRAESIILQLTKALTYSTHNLPDDSYARGVFQEAAHVVAKIFTGLDVSNAEVEVLNDNFEDLFQEDNENDQNQNNSNDNGSASQQPIGFVAEVLRNYQKYRPDLKLGMSLSALWVKKSAEDIQQFLSLCMNPHPKPDESKFLYGFFDLETFYGNEIIFKDVTAIALARKLLGTDQVHADDTHLDQILQTHNKGSVGVDSVTNLNLPIKLQLPGRYSTLEKYSESAPRFVRHAPKGLDFYSYLERIFVKDKFTLG